MGWGRTFLLGDIGNRLDIGDCEDAIGSIKNSLHQTRALDDRQDATLEALQAESDQLKLYLAALIRLLVTKGVVSVDEISRFIDIIDAEDGTVDGKASGETV